MQGNHIYTSGATGTNAAVIRGALRAEKPDLLTVVLPQSLSLQPPESRELLAEVRRFLQHMPGSCVLSHAHASACRILPTARGKPLEVLHSRFLDRCACCVSPWGAFTCR